MSRPGSIQEWVHWLEVGAGARWIRRAALLLGVGLLSVVIGYKQFRGPRTEATLAQAVVGRELANGRGFVTPVNYPQSTAFFQQRGKAVESGALPEIHNAPLYSLVIAGVLAVLPEDFLTKLFSRVPVPPDGFGADYVLLVLNVVLLWIAAAQTYSLGKKLFEPAVGLIAALGVLLSVALWSETVAVNGTPLAMVLLLAFFNSLFAIEPAPARERGSWGPPLAAGLYGGLLFLCDYWAAVAILGALAWFWWRLFGPARGRAMLFVAVGFILAGGPWMVRNAKVTGNPLGLAWQGIALKAGDSTAEPATVRATLSAVSPGVDLAKLGNKILTSLQENLRVRLWAGGGLFLAAFFVAGFIYQFRREEVNQLRWLFVATLFALLLAQAFFDSGEGERLPVVYATPLIAIFGAAFFVVLVASNEKTTTHLRLAATLLLLLQALPLARDLLEPRRLHFSYPPYYPALFMGMREETSRRGARTTWMADVPAGAAWYGGQRVWAQPATMRDFHAVVSAHPMLALVLTPKTLDKPFFAELTRKSGETSRLGEWAQVYAGLVTNRFPSGFPLSLAQKLDENLYVLIDPLAAPLQK
jgi:hypothetical protein